MTSVGVNVLRLMTDRDLDLVLSWRNAAPVRSNMYTNHIISIDEHKSWFQRERSNEASRLLIYEKNGIPKGFVSFTKIDKKSNRADWAFYSGELEERGLGAAMEILALKYAFEVLDLHKLCCEVLSFNQPVVNFHLKFGFIEEGILKQHYLREDTYYDIYLLAFFRKQWDSQKIELEAKLMR